MNTAVRYYTRSGNTKKVAEAIARGAGCKALTIESAISEPVDVLFLGASVYAYGIDAKVKRFIQSLSRDKVKKVVVFSTSALAERAFSEIEKAIKATGIPVEPRDFYCRGSFLNLHKGRPNQSDLNDAEAFAKSFL